MTDPHDIAGPVLEHLRRQQAEEGLVAWPGDLTEEEQLGFIELYRAENGDDWLGVVSIRLSYVRECLAAGRLVE